MHQKGIVCGKRVRSEPAEEEGAAMLLMAGVLLLGGSPCRTKKSPPLLFVLLMIMLLQCTASVAASGVAFQKTETLTGHTGSVRAVSFSHDSSLLASGSVDSTVIITDTATWTPVATLTDHTREVWAVTFSHDSSLLASGSSDTTTVIYNVLQPECNGLPDPTECQTTYKDKCSSADLGILARKQCPAMCDSCTPSTATTTLAATSATTITSTTTTTTAALTTTSATTTTPTPSRTTTTTVTSTTTTTFTATSSATLTSTTTTITMAALTTTSGTMTTPTTSRTTTTTVISTTTTTKRAAATTTPNAEPSTVCGVPDAERGTNTCNGNLYDFSQIQPSNGKIIYPAGVSVFGVVFLFLYFIFLPPSFLALAITDAPTPPDPNQSTYILMYTPTRQIVLLWP